MITAENVRELFSYDPEDGRLIWRVPHGRHGRIPAGYVVQTVSTRSDDTSKASGIVLGYKGKMYLAHRVAFLYMTGRWPVGVIDHINGNPTDNRWSNLRDVPIGLNVQNRPSENRSGLRWVYPCGPKYVALIRADNKQVYLGRFDCPQKAHEAAAQRAAEVYGKLARVK